MVEITLGHLEGIFNTVEEPVKTQLIRYIYSRVQYFNLHWNFDGESDAVANNFIYPIVKPEMDVVVKSLEKLFDDSGNFIGIGEKSYNETGTSKTDSMAEISPLNDIIGDIKTPTSKGNGVNEYSRNNKVTGDVDVLKNAMKYANEENTFYDFVFDRMKKFIYNYLLIE